MKRTLLTFGLLGMGLVGCQTTAPQPAKPTFSTQILRPDDFKSGSVTIKLANLGKDESVAVIPVNAEQRVYPEGFSYDLSVNQIATPAYPVVAAQSVQTTSNPAEDRRLALREKHLDFQKRQEARARALLARGVKPIDARSLQRQGAPFTQCIAPYAMGQECKFWMYNADDGQDQVTTKLRMVSKNAYWYVDVRDDAEFTEADLKAFVKVFEETMYPTDVKHFGQPADLDQNGKIKIVFSRNVADIGAYGYVDYLDFLPDQDTMDQYQLHSNEGDIFYSAIPSAFEPDISRESMLSYDLPSTLVHELKHLIAGGQRMLNGFPDEQSWIEEASAVSAEELSGYGTQKGDYAMAMSRKGVTSPQNVRVYLPDTQINGESGNFYGYNFLFAWRAAEQVGHDTFWPRWTMSDQAGIANLEKATGKRFPDLMLDFAQTLMFSNTGIAPQFDFKSINVRNHLQTDLKNKFAPLGYRPLKNLSDTARSMAYYVGQGQGQDASITLKTDFKAPYLIVARFKGNLPWKPANTLAGQINIPEGYSLLGTTLDLCQLDKGECTDKSSHRRLNVAQLGTQGTFSYTGLPSGMYQLTAYKDQNKNGQPDAGDLQGCVKAGNDCAKLDLSHDDLVLNLAIK